MFKFPSQVWSHFANESTHGFFDLPHGGNLLILQVQQHEPDLWTHLVRYEIQPLRLVFRWIMRGFSGHLGVSST